MKALAKGIVSWPNIDSDIERTVQNCKPCQTNLPSAPRTSGNAWKWPTRPWQRIHIDYATYQRQDFLIVVDACSKWPEVVHMKSTTTEATITALRNIFARYGLPQEIMSDNGPQFVSKEFKHFLKANNIKELKSPPFNPPTNALAECFVQTFKHAMNNLRRKPGTWAHMIASFLLSYRMTPHSATKTAPAEFLMGWQLRTRLSAVRPELAG